MWIWLIYCKPDVGQDSIHHLDLIGSHPNMGVRMICHVFCYQWHLELCIPEHLDIPLTLVYSCLCKWPQVCVGRGRGSFHCILVIKLQEWCSSPEDSGHLFSQQVLVWNLTKLGKQSWHFSGEIISLLLIDSYLLIFFHTVFIVVKYT